MAVQDARETRRGDWMLYQGITGEKRREGQSLQRHLCGPVGGYTGCEGRRGGLHLGLRVVRRYLALVFVEVERGVKLRLLYQKLLKTPLMLEGAVKLLPVLGQRF